MCGDRVVQEVRAMLGRSSSRFCDEVAMKLYSPAQWARSAVPMAIGAPYGAFGMPRDVTATRCGNCFPIGLAS